MLPTVSILTVGNNDFARQVICLTNLKVKVSYNSSNQSKLTTNEIEIIQTTLTHTQTHNVVINNFLICAYILRAKL